MLTALEYSRAVCFCILVAILAAVPFSFLEHIKAWYCIVALFLFLQTSKAIVDITVVLVRKLCHCDATHKVGNAGYLSLSMVPEVSENIK